MARLKSVLITGCSDGGIGSALAHAFAERGFFVIATARDLKKMRSLEEKENVMILDLDVTSDHSIQSAYKRASQWTNGHLDYLINNAAQGRFMPTADETVEGMRALFDTNVFGPVAMIKTFLPLLINSKGTIVNITSISGYINMPWMGTYGATKRSLQIISESLRLELQQFDIRVLSVITGAVKTNGHTYFKDWKLPSDSRYKGQERSIWEFANGTNRNDSQLTPEQYAAQAIPRMIDPKTKGVIWGPGFTTGFIRFADSWLPRWATDSMWIKASGMKDIVVTEEKS